MRRFPPCSSVRIHDYRRADFFSDLSAGLTVGIYALPLELVLQFASGVTPQQDCGRALSLVWRSRSGRLAFPNRWTNRRVVPVLFSIVAIRLRRTRPGRHDGWRNADRGGRAQDGPPAQFFPYPVIGRIHSGIAVIIFVGNSTSSSDSGLNSRTCATTAPPRWPRISPM